MTKRLILRLNRLAADSRGTTIIELAFVLPIMLIFVFGIMQLGMIFEGQAGMSHALGEGARLATLYPSPPDTAIKTMMQDSVFKATNFGTYEVYTPVRSGASVLLEVRYTMPMKFFMIDLPDVTLDRQKLVYTASKVS